MQIRQLRPSDASAAQELLKQLGYDADTNDLTHRIEHVLVTENHFGAVAEDQGKVIGLVHVYKRPALEKPCEAVVQSLIVDTRLRNMGIGRALMDAAEAWARKIGLTHVVLSTRIDREDARTFYERLGYERVATSKSTEPDANNQVGCHPPNAKQVDYRYTNVPTTWCPK